MKASRFEGIPQNGQSRPVASVDRCELPVKCRVKVIIGMLGNNTQCLPEIMIAIISVEGHAFNLTTCTHQGHMYQCHTHPEVFSKRSGGCLSCKETEQAEIHRQHKTAETDGRKQEKVEAKRTFLGARKERLPKRTKKAKTARPRDKGYGKRPIAQKCFAVLSSTFADLLTSS